MSAIAGRVLILPKGEYDASVTYEFLDLINYGGRSWLAKKASLGIEPTDANSEYWQPFGSSVTPDGVTIVIDENGVISAVGGTAEKVTYENESVADVTNVKEALDGIFNGTNPVGNSKKLGGKDASEYITTDGGTTKGDIIAKTTEEADIKVKAENALKAIALYIDKSGVGGLFDSNNGKWVLQSAEDGTNTFNGTASGNLPLSGGRLDSKTATVLGLNAVENDVAFLQFLSKAVNMGHLGFSGVNKPVFRDASSNYYDLLHTGNKPTGTYTGNGDATQRTIATGGIGNVIYVKAQNGFAIVTTGGYIAMSGGTVSCGADAYVSNGSLKISSTLAVLNADGITYTYQVL